MKLVLVSFHFLLAAFVAQSQTVNVSVTTDKKEAEAILKKQRETTRINQAYFAEDEKCRNLLKSSEWLKAEASCRSAITLVEKLPKEHVLERSSSRLALAIALLFQRKADEAVKLLNESLEIGKPVLDDTDAETGERYFFLGHAYRLADDTDASAKYYAKAETTYRTAFKRMGEDEFLGRQYAKWIVRILEAHIALLKSSGDDPAALEKRLSETIIELNEYLKESS